MCTISFVILKETRQIKGIVGLTVVVCFSDNLYSPYWLISYVIVKVI